MNPITAAHHASALLGRRVPEGFATSVLWGDQFVYAKANDRDPDAASAVLGVATGRLTTPKTNKEGTRCLTRRRAC